MSTEIKEHSFDTGVVAINYAEGPASGPPLMLLHGGSARWQSFESIMPDLAAEWHLYAPDFRGHGKSGRVAGGYRLQDYADDTIAFLRQQLSEAAVILGPGPIGLLTLLSAKLLTPKVTVVTGRSVDVQPRLALAERLGADETINVDETDPSRSLSPCAGAPPPLFPTCAQS